MNRIEMLKKLIEDQPSEPFNRYALALEYKKTNDHKQALKLFDQLIKESPEYIATYFHYGSILDEVEHPKKALEIYRLGIEKAREQGEHHAMSELKNALLNLELELDL